MGLDMYLERQTYVRSLITPTKPDTRAEVAATHLFLNGESVLGIDHSRVTYVTEEIAYWRKANAIHNWFVQKCQDGVDECQRTHVTKLQLQELVDLCKQVLATVETVEGEINCGTCYHGDGTVEHLTEPGQVVAQPAIADKLLPTQGGFFFGQTDYDERYIDDLKETVEMIEPFLKLDKETDQYSSYYYQSSW
jgi:hypothetical protein